MTRGGSNCGDYPTESGAAVEFLRRNRERIRAVWCDGIASTMRERGIEPGLSEDELRERADRVVNHILSRLQQSAGNDEDGDVPAWLYNGLPVSVAVELLRGFRGTVFEIVREDGGTERAARVSLPIIEAIGEIIETLIGRYQRVQEDALAGQRRRLRDHLRTRDRQMSEARVIARIGQLLLELPTVEGLLQNVAEAIREYRNYVAVSLYRISRDGAYNRVGHAGPGQRQSQLFSSVESCIDTGKPMGPEPAPGMGEERCTRLVVPIERGETLLGAMCCVSDSDSAFGTGEREGLSYISTQIALAMERADMLEERRRDRRELQKLHGRLQAIMENAAVGIASVGPDGVFTHWSRSCERLTGYSAGEVVGRMTPADLSANPSTAANLLDRGREEGQHSREEVILTADGTPRITRQMLVPIENGPPAAEGYTLCMLDITEKKRQEEELRRERNKLNRVVGAMGAGLALFDAERRLRWANDKLKDWFGVDEANGQICRDTYGCSRDDCSDCPMMSNETPDEVRSLTMEKREKDGGWKCYLHVTTRAEVGEAQYLVVTTDITEQRRRTEQMRYMDHLSRFLQRSLDLEKVLHQALMCVTGGRALGFNRAFVFLLDDDGDVLSGCRAAGTPGKSEVQQRGYETRGEEAEMEELLESAPSEQDRRLSERVRDVKIHLREADCAVVEALRRRSPIIVSGTDSDWPVAPELRQELDLDQFVAVPLITGDQPLGVMVAEHKYRGGPIESQSVEELQMFATQASLAIANARAYRRVNENLEKLQKTQAKLLESERLASVGRMATQLAHQMRTPLALIGGYARAIERSAGEDDRIQRNAATIYQEEQRLEREINEILEFSRPIEIELEPADLNEVVRQTLDRFAQACRDGDVTINMNPGENCNGVEVDRQKFGDALANIVHNAIQALGDQEDRRIDVRTSCQKGKACVEIRDNGPGMDEETREKIFAPFFTTRKDGTGLGLAIARRVIRKHDGEIDVKTGRGEGARFLIRFPPAQEGGEDSEPEKTRYGV